MNIINHYRATKKFTGSTKCALASMLPDLFLRTNMHNTKDAEDRMFGISPVLGRAWRLHKDQDMRTHSYTYDWADKIPGDSVLLLSGGLDSFCQWRLLGMPKAIHFNIGNKASQVELNKIHEISETFDKEIIEIDNLDLSKFEQPNGYIPYRNLFFIMLASLYSPNIVMCQVSEWAPDKNRQFYRRAEKFLYEIAHGKYQEINIKPKIYAPFASYTKTKLVREYIKKYPIEDLTKYTVSCYSGNRLPCGKCSACRTRHVAMINNDIEEEYESIPDIKETKRKLSLHDFRLENILMYVRRWNEYREFTKKPR